MSEQEKQQDKPEYEIADIMNFLSGLEDAANECMHSLEYGMDSLSDSYESGKDTENDVTKVLDALSGLEDIANDYKNGIADIFESVSDIDSPEHESIAEHTEEANTIDVAQPTAADHQNPEFIVDNSRLEQGIEQLSNRMAETSSDIKMMHSALSQDLQKLDRSFEKLAQALDPKSNDLSRMLGEFKEFTGEVIKELREELAPLSVVYGELISGMEDIRHKVVEKGWVGKEQTGYIQHSDIYGYTPEEQDNLQVTSPDTIYNNSINNHAENSRIDDSFDFDLDDHENQYMPEPQEQEHEYSLER